MTQTTVTERPTEQDQAVQLLWTGGWDSSFRLMQLLLIERRAVQPIYVLNRKRRSASNELATMRAMRDGLLARMPDPALLHPTTVVIGDEFTPRPELVEVDRSLRARGHFGNQYLMLAGVGEALGWRGVELSVERYETGLVEWEQAVFTVPGRLNDSREAQLFASWSFPVIHLTKEEMGQIARDHGFYDLLVLRWFCHQPLMGEPCGYCRPCQLANKDGVKFASPVLAQARRSTRRAAGKARRGFERLQRSLPAS